MQIADDLESCLSCRYWKAGLFICACDIVDGSVQSTVDWYWKWCHHLCTTAWKCSWSVW